MSFADGIVKGRSHIVFMLGLITAGGIIISLERSALLQPPRPVLLDSARIEAATVAWQATAGSAADDPEATRLAERLGVDTQTPLSPGPRAMSPAAGRAVLQALALQSNPARRVSGP